MLAKSARAACALSGLARLALAGLRPEPPAREPVERVLVLGYAAVGDLLFLLPLLRALRRAWPKARVTFVANRYPTTTELLPALGLVDEIRTIELDDASQAAARASIREGRFDVAVVSMPTPLRVIGPALMGIPRRAGHCRALRAPHRGWSWPRYAFWRLRRGLAAGEFERRLVLNCKVWVGEKEEHMVASNLALAAALGVPVGPGDWAPPELNLPKGAEDFAAGLLGPGAWLGVHIGAPTSQYGKIWPPEKLAAVCMGLAESHRVQVVLVGGKDEGEAARRFAAAHPGTFVNAVGTCGLLESFAVIKRCSLFLSSDTGMSKAAMALGTPSATVWGPVERSGQGVFWAPERHLEVRRDLACMPCVRFGMPEEGAGVINFTNCGHRACLGELTPQTVLAALRGRYGDVLPRR